MITQHRQIDEEHPEGKSLWAGFMAAKLELVNVNDIQITL
jgi:hypothetical protein